MGTQQDESSDGSALQYQSANEAARRQDLRRRPTKVDRLDDLLPENVHYRDDGCEVSSSCLACPLPVCRYEVRGGLAALQRAPRDAELLTAHKNGAGIEG